MELTPEKRKELAFNLIGQLQEMATKVDDELTRLRKLEDPSYKKVGTDVVTFHLGILKELIEGM